MSVWILSVSDLEKTMKDGTAGHKFNRLSSDISEIASYMHDIRICFMALTVTVYIVLGIIGMRAFCAKRQKNRANARRPRGQWEYGNDGHPDYRNQTGQMDDLVSVRSDGQVGTGQTVTTQANAQPGAPAQVQIPLGGQPAFMRSNNRAAAPFMRHGRMHNNYNNTMGNQARLISDTDTVKHQIPHITTQEVPDANGGSQPSSPPPAPTTNTTTPTPRTLHHRTTAASVEVNGGHHNGHGYRHATDM
uniref:Protein tweety homolog n=1 Tax=Bursaphelenchus xylophilus TaxID=6326 RepID=A0A1I7SDI3_BURXY